MLKDLSLLLVFASFEIVNCQKPPRIPYVYLPGQKFSLPPICSNVAEWQDIARSLEILTDMTEPKREKSAFTSLMNLIKFVLVKEELSCPVIQQMTHSGGKISNAVNTLQNSKIIANIEAALARKPVKVERVVVNDNIDIPNMIPVLRARGKSRRKGAAAAETAKSNSTSAEPKVAQDVGATLLETGKPGVNIGSKAPCQCSKCTPLSLNLASLQSLKSNLPCQRLQIVNLSPVVMGCGRNCNICQKLNPTISQSPRLSPVILIGGERLSNPSAPRGNQRTSVQTTTQEGSKPLLNCYGNMLNKVTTSILVPYCLAKLA